MKVFISWSGLRSRYLAEALRAWLPLVIQSVKPWMSDEDVAAGSRWLPEIAGELGEAKVGILCITPENQVSPWLVFEAGALSKTIGQTFVCPMLYDITASQLSGPLAQFQASTFERAGVLRVLQNLNSALAVERLQEGALEEIFDVWWPKLEGRLSAIPSLDTATIARRTTDDLLAEILSLSREQLRRENLRLEHSQARDERLDQIIPIFEQVATTTKVLQEKGRGLLNSLGQGPIPIEVKQMLSNDISMGKLDDIIRVMHEVSEQSKLDDIIRVMHEVSEQSKLETQQILSEQGSPADTPQPKT